MGCQNSVEPPSPTSLPKVKKANSFSFLEKHRTVTNEGQICQKNLIVVQFPKKVRQSNKVVSTMNYSPCRFPSDISHRAPKHTSYLSVTSDKA